MAGAEAVIMGGSFVSAGGHNFLEAAALAKPVIVGPDMSDFSEETAQFLRHGALLQEKTLHAALAALQALARAPERGQTQGRRGQGLLSRQASRIAADYFDALGLSVG